MIEGTVSAMDAAQAQLDLTLASAGEVCITGQIRMNR